MKLSETADAAFWPMALLAVLLLVWRLKGKSPLDGVTKLMALGSALLFAATWLPQLFINAFTAGETRSEVPFVIFGVLRDLTFLGAYATLGLFAVRLGTGGTQESDPKP